MARYVLHYFDCYGRAEPIRMMFSLAGVEYTDRRFSFAEWPQLKHQHPFVFGQAPILEEDGKVLPQSFAITRYIANKYGFAGETPYDRALVDALADYTTDYLEKCRDFYVVACKYKEGDLEALKTEKFLPARDEYFKKLSDFINNNPAKSGFLVGSSLTWADLLVFNHVLIFNNFVPNFEANYPKIVELREKIAAIPKMKEHLATRPKSIQ